MGAKIAPSDNDSREMAAMVTLLWAVAIVVLVLWLMGAFVMNVGGGLIHILLVVVLVLVIYNLLTGRKRAP